jgi:hypothetical protein
MRATVRVDARNDPKVDAPGRRDREESSRDGDSGRLVPMDAADDEDARGAERVASLVGDDGPPLNRVAQDVSLVNARRGEREDREEDGEAHAASTGTGQTRVRVLLACAPSPSYPWYSSRVAS